MRNRGLRRAQGRGAHPARRAAAAGVPRLRLGRGRGRPTRASRCARSRAGSPTWPRSCRPGSRATIGIGHTRWATHGVPSDVNAHPHTVDRRAHRRRAQRHHRERRRAARQAERRRRGVRLRDRHRGARPPDRRAPSTRPTRWRRPSARPSSSVVGTYGIAVIDAERPGRGGRGAQRQPDRARHRREGDVRRLRRGRAGPLHPPGRAPGGRRAGRAARPTASTPSPATRGETAKEPLTVDWDAGHYDTGGYEHYLLKEISEQPETRHAAPCAAGSTSASHAPTWAGSNMDARETRVVPPGEDPRLRLGLLRRPDRRAADRGAGPHPGRRRAGQRVPLPQPRRRPRHALRRGQPVRRDLRHAGRRAGAQAQGRPGHRHRQRRRQRHRPRVRRRHLPARRARRSSVASTKAFTSTAVAFALLALHLGRVRDLSPADGRRIVRGPAQAARADRARSSPQSDKIAELAQKYAGHAEHDVRRPGARLPGGPRGRAEAQGDLLRPRRGLPGQRAQARPARADRPRDADGGDRPRRRAARQEPHHARRDPRPAAARPDGRPPRARRQAGRRRDRGARRTRSSWTRSC